MKLKTIAIDFDGVLHKYSRGWDDGSIYDDPTPGAKEALEYFMQDYAVFILTTREKNSVAEWVRDRFKVLTTVFQDGNEPFKWDIKGAVLVTNKKLPAEVYIDDRGIQFKSWTQAIADFESFELARATK